MIRALVFIAVCAIQPVYAAKIIYGVPAAIGSLNPYLLNGIESYRVTGLVIEALARVEPFSQTLEPVLARDWKIDHKKKTLHVRLREGVRFHGGQPFTAEDVAFTWNSYFDPKFKGEVWRAMWDDVESVKAEGPLAVEFKFKTLRYQTFQNLMTAMRILPKSYYSNVNHEEWASKLIGSGPFRVERFHSNRAVELRPHGDWWGWKAYGLEPAPVIVVKSIPEPRLAEQMLGKSQLDVYEIPSGHVPPGTKFTELKSAFGQGVSLGLNLRLDKLADLRVRKALLALWNRDALNRKVYGGRFKPALDSFSPNTGYYPPGEPAPYDLKNAKRLLKEAGHGQGLSLKILVNSPEAERWAGLYQNDAAKAGIKITLEKVMDESQWWQQVNGGKYEMVAYDGAFSERPHSSVWHSKGAYNSSGIKDAELDAVLDRLEGEFDPAKRAALTKSSILRLREVTAELPGLYSGNTYFLLSPEVTVKASAPLQAWHWRKKD